MGGLFCGGNMAYKISRTRGTILSNHSAAYASNRRPSHRSNVRNNEPVSQAFSPLSIAGLLVWLKADSISGNDGDAIATWSDSSGNGFDATQVTGTKQPLLKKGVNGINGKNVLRFDGSNDAMGNSTKTALGTGDYHIFFLVKRNGGLSWRTAFASGNSAGSNTMISAQDAVDNIYVNPFGSGTNVTDGAFTDATAILIEVKEVSGTVSVKKYGGSETSGALVTSPDAGYVIGDYDPAVTSQPFPGDIAELVIYPSVISGQNLTDLEAYFATKYGI